MKKTILAPAAALSLGLTGAFGAAAAPAFADTVTPDDRGDANAAEDPSAAPSPVEEPSGASDDPEPNDGADSSEGTDDAGAGDPTPPSEGGAESPEEITSFGHVGINTRALTVSDAVQSGVKVTYGSGEPGHTILFELKKSGSDAVLDSSTQTVGETGAATADFVLKAAGDDTSSLIGNYVITAQIVTASGNVDLNSTSFTVYADDGEAPAPPTASIDKSELTLEEAVSSGVRVSVKGAPEGDTVSLEVRRKGSDKAIGTWWVTVGGDGSGSETITLEHSPEAVGDYEIDVWVEGADSSYEVIDTLSFAVVDGSAEDPSDPGDAKPTDPGAKPGDEAEAGDPALKLSEKTITAADFVNDEKGIVATVNNLEPGTEVKYTVAGTSGSAKNVRTFEQTIKADDKGNAVFTVAGVDDKHPESYLGKYSITAEFDGKKLKDSFEVVSKKGDGKGGSDSGDKGGAEGGGSTNADSGASDSYSASDDTSGDADSGYLPRTGQGLGALAAGAALLTIGGATVLLTRRRRA